MKLIVGLGNPGKKFEGTRHNTGFLVLDKLVSKIAEDQWLMDKKFNSLIINLMPSVMYCKPQTFMNSSGLAVSKLVNFYKIERDDLFVVHDDLDISLGEYKIQKGKGPREHNGLLSIYEKLGSKEFWHVRVGIDNRTNSKEQWISGEDYVLQQFPEDEAVAVNDVLENLTNDLIKHIND